MAHLCRASSGHLKRRANGHLAKTPCGAAVTAPCNLCSGNVGPPTLRVVLADIVLEALCCTTPGISTIWTGPVPVGTYDIGPLKQINNGFCSWSKNFTVAAVTRTVYSDAGCTVVSRTDTFTQLNVTFALEFDGATGKVFKVCGAFLISTNFPNGFKVFDYNLAFPRAGDAPPLPLPIACLTESETLANFFTAASNCDDTFIVAGRDGTATISVPG